MATRLAQSKGMACTEGGKEAGGCEAQPARATAAISIDVRPMLVTGVWVCDDNQFLELHGGRETASPDQTRLDVGAVSQPVAGIVWVSFHFFFSG